MTERILGPQERRGDDRRNERALVSIVQKIRWKGHESWCSLRPFSWPRGSRCSPLRGQLKFSPRMSSSIAVYSDHEDFDPMDFYCPQKIGYLERHVRRLSEDIEKTSRRS